MKKNGIKEAWNNGQTIINGWSSIANTFNAEIMAASGFDSITIDMQHGLVGYQKAVEMLQAISGYNITPMAASYTTLTLPTILPC